MAAKLHDRYQNHFRKIKAPCTDQGKSNLNGRVHFSTEPNTIFTSSNKRLASSSSENQTRPYCGDQLELDLSYEQSVQANAKETPGDDICASQWERYAARDGQETAER